MFPLALCGIKNKTFGSKYHVSYETIKINGYPETQFGKMSTFNIHANKIEDIVISIKLPNNEYIDDLASVIIKEISIFSNYKLIQSITNLCIYALSSVECNMSNNNCVTNKHDTYDKRSDNTIYIKLTPLIMDNIRKMFIINGIQFRITFETFDKLVVNKLQLHNDNIECYLYVKTLLTASHSIIGVMNEYQVKLPICIHNDVVCEISCNEPTICKLLCNTIIKYNITQNVMQIVFSYLDRPKFIDYVGNIVCKQFVNKIYWMYIRDAPLPSSSVYKYKSEHNHKHKHEYTYFDHDNLVSDEILFEANGCELLPAADTNYYTFIQQMFGNGIFNSNIYSYSLTGSISSGIDFELVEHFRIKQRINVGKSQPGTYRIHIFALTLNVLKYYENDISFTYNIINK